MNALKDGSTKINTITDTTAATGNALIRRLKSSLKIISCPSSSSSSSSGSILKNVRFAPELTTVKKFDCQSEPSSISNENSPTLYPLDEISKFNYMSLDNYIGGDDSDNDGDDNEGFWFKEIPILNNVKNNSNKNHSRYNEYNLKKFSLDSDSDSSLDDYQYYNLGDENPMIMPTLSLENHNMATSLDFIDNTISGLNPNLFVIKKWDLQTSNLKMFKQYLNEENLFQYLNNQNIRLHSLKQLDDSKLSGLIYVNNLNFEKFIEIKFSFNNWKDIHYVTANFNKSITNKIDEFKFIIDLNSLKYTLQFKGLIYNENSDSLDRLNITKCPLNVNLCCRYDVNNETYYDNNYYENYQMSLIVETENCMINEQTVRSPSITNVDEPTETCRAYSKTSDSFLNDFLTTTTLTHSKKRITNANISRRFSEDTDYYNTSPLKHLYHNDTTLIKPAKANSVLVPPIINPSSTQTRSDIINNKTETTISENAKITNDSITLMEVKNSNQSTIVNPVINSLLKNVAKLENNEFQESISSVSISSSLSDSISSHNSSVSINSFTPMAEYNPGVNPLNYIHYPMNLSNLTSTSASLSSSSLSSDFQYSTLTMANASPPLFNRDGNTNNIEMSNSRVNVPHHIMNLASSDEISFDDNIANSDIFDDSHSIITDTTSTSSGTEIVVGNDDNNYFENDYDFNDNNSIATSINENSNDVMINNIINENIGFNINDELNTSTDTLIHPTPPTIDSLLKPASSSSSSKSSASSFSPRHTKSPTQSLRINEINQFKDKEYHNLLNNYCCYSSPL